MKTYQTDGKYGIAFLGFFALLIGMFFVGVTVVPTARDLIDGNTSAYQGSGGLGILIGAAVGGGGAYLGWLYIWRRVCEIRLPGDGSVEMIGTIRHSKIAGSDVIELRRSLAKLTFEDADARELRVQSRRGTLVIPYFDGIEGLVADIKALDARIEVTGEWPRIGE